MPPSPGPTSPTMARQAEPKLLPPAPAWRARGLAVVALGTLLLQGATSPSTQPPAFLVDAQKLAPGLVVELKYATADNFMHRVLYPSLKACYLQREAAQKLAKAQAWLAVKHPGHRLRAYDCARPRSVQKAMWALVAGTPQAPYVANPHDGVGSIHNYGGAVDLTLDGPSGKPLDMGTPYDHFGELAHIDREEEFLRAGRLTASQVANRRLLRQAMTEAGFLPLSNEWWHFNAVASAEARRRFRVWE